ncbi:MAG: glycosyltransferase family 2 protein [Acidimicrobiia bacterium]|nr:glycosyltransferase family 2 protein [Acidimicrobiia bacterium]MDX2466751.1 glycosyltransferase family 2 protein [Acidimicrobiia bacterium]
MPHSPQTGVSILMPAYQLESVIADNVDRVVEVVGDWPGVEIIVIDDGSTDDTKGFAEKAASAHESVSAVSYPINRGKGGALKEGFTHASGDTIVFLDSDLDLPPEQLPTFLTEFEHQGVDALVGAKRTAMAPGRYPALRRLLILAFAGVNRVLFRLPVHETQTGLKAFKRSALQDTLPNLETDGYTFDLELLIRIRKAGGSLAEAPVALAPGSSSGLSLATLWEMGRDTLAIWVKSFRWK